MGVESSALWKNRSFLLLWLAQLTANIGDQCYSFALLWYLLQATQSGTALSLLAIPEMTAGLLFYLIGGVLADRYNPRSLMVGADLARISIAVLVGIMTALGVKQFAFFLAAQFLIGVFSSLFHPARTVALKAIVPIEQLSRSNAILDTTFRTVRIAAPMTIGVIAAWVPLSTLFFINAFAYLLSACFLYALGKIPRSGQETVTSRLSAGQYIRDIGYGLKELQTNRLLFVILLFSNMGFLVWQVCWNVGFPFLANEMGQGDSSMLAVLIGFYGIGNLLGSLFMARLQYQRHLLVIIAGWLVHSSADAGARPPLARFFGSRHRGRWRTFDRNPHRYRHPNKGGRFQHRQNLCAEYADVHRIFHALQQHGGPVARNMARQRAIFRKRIVPGHYVCARIGTRAEGQTGQTPVILGMSRGLVFSFCSFQKRRIAFFFLMSYNLTQIYNVR